MNPDKRRLLSNIGSLFVLQGTNYVLPLITVPYLVRIIGPSKYGLIAFSQAFIQYFILLTDYGFNLTATRKIALSKGAPNKISEIYNLVFIIKLALLLISFTALFLTVNLIGKFRSEALIYYLTFLSVIGNALFPVWLYQGLQKIKYISVINIIAKTIANLAIFVFVKKQTDYPLVAGIQSSGFLLAGLLGLLFSLKLVKPRLLIPSIKNIKDELLEGWHIFTSSAAVSLYTNTNMVILGLLSGDIAVGFFGGADKIIKAFQGLINPISQAIYPHISELVGRSKKEAVEFINKTLKIYGGYSFLISLGLFLFSGFCVRTFLGNQFGPSIILVKWMSPLIFLIALSNVFGVQTMITFGLNREFSYTLIASGIFNMLTIFPLAHFFGAEGAAISLLLTEAGVTLAMGYILNLKGINIFKPSRMTA